MYACYMSSFHPSLLTFTHEPHVLHAGLDHVDAQEPLLGVEVAGDSHRLARQRALPLVVDDVLLVPVEGGLVGEHAHLAWEISIGQKARRYRKKIRTGKTESLY
jgi:hypothetical protein